MAETWQTSVSSTLVGAAVAAEFGELTADVPAEAWRATALSCRDRLGLTFFDWLSAVDEGDQTFSVVLHVYDPVAHRRLLVRTHLDERAQRVPRIDSLTSVYAGASWHERETFEMFGIEFDGHPNLVPLLLPDGFSGRPLRKDFVLVSRAVKPWPGAKEPGESGSSPGRRKTLPPGVPDPATWGSSAASSDDGSEPSGAR